MSKKNVARIAAGSTVLVAGSAFAAVDAAVSTALGTSATDVATIGGLVLVVIVGAMTFKYLRRAL